MDPEQDDVVVNKGTSLKRKRIKLPKTVLKEQLHEFSTVTTLHGLRYVTDRRLSVFEKLFWLVIFSLSVGFCIYRINVVWTKWQESPILVTVNENLVPVGSVPFPSVTICPQMKTRATIFNYTAVQQNVFKFSPTDEKVSNEDLQVFEALMFLCNDMLTNIFYIATHGMITRHNSSPSIMENLLMVAPRIDDVMSSCKWRNKAVECSNLFKTVLTAQGVCFTMNAIQTQEMLSRDNVWSDYNFSNLTRNETRRGWTTNGYYDPNEKDPYPRRGRGDGAKAELEITLTETQIDHDQVCNSLNNGFKVYIQNPDDMPGSSTHYYVVAPEKQTELFLKFNMLSTAEKLRDISSETRQCYFPEEHPLRYFKIYTASNCNMECLANITYERCKCVGFHMPRENNTKICTFLYSLCMESAQEALAEKQAKYSYLHTETEEKHETCNCLPSCNTVDYDADIMRSDFNRKAYLRSLTAILDYDKVYNLTKSKTYSVMRMYYKQPRYVSMRRSELFGITDFLANCGGLLGLFLGFSFLSLVEIIYFVTIRLWCTIKRNAKEEITTQN